MERRHVNEESLPPLELEAQVPLYGAVQTPDSVEYRLAYESPTAKWFWWLLLASYILFAVGIALWMAPLDLSLAVLLIPVGGVAFGHIGLFRLRQRGMQQRVVFRRPTQRRCAHVEMWSRGRLVYGARFDPELLNIDAVADTKRHRAKLSHRSCYQLALAVPEPDPDSVAIYQSDSPGACFEQGVALCQELGLSGEAIRLSVHFAGPRQLSL